MCLPSPPCLALLSWVPSFPFSLCSPVILPSLPRVPRCPLSMIRATPRPFCRCGRCHGSVQLFVALPVVCSYFDSSLSRPSAVSCLCASFAHCPPFVIFRWLVFLLVGLTYGIGAVAGQFVSLGITRGSPSAPVRPCCSRGGAAPCCLHRSF